MSARSPAIKGKIREETDVGLLGNLVLGPLGNLLGLAGVLLDDREDRVDRLLVLLSGKRGGARQRQSGRRRAQKRRTDRLALDIANDIVELVK